MEAGREEELPFKRLRSLAMRPARNFMTCRWYTGAGIAVAVLKREVRREVGWGLRR